jgi:hypothetical protein
VKRLAGLGTVLFFLAACGHMANPAPPKAELALPRDDGSSCEELNAEILDLQAKRASTQKQLDKQKAQNIISGIGGWFIIVPYLFLDVTTDKNAAYNSYAEREEHLRKLGEDKNCRDLPKPYEVPVPQKVEAFVPSGGNVKQDHSVAR